MTDKPDPAAVPETTDFPSNELARLREKNGPRPCDCTSCDCGNSGDAYRVGSWDGTEWAIKELEARMAESHEHAGEASPAA